VGEVDVGHVASTRVWVEMTIRLVPVGTQTAWLLCTTSGAPPTSTRAAPTTHCPLTHGPLPPGGTNGQPATTYGVASVETGIPLTRTRGLGEVGWAWPPCMQVTTAPTWTANPGIR